MDSFPLCIKLVLLSFFVFITRLPGTKQDDDNSSPCRTPVTVEDAKAKLRANGIAINKNYMAFTLAEAKLNFKNLITMEPMNFSSIVKQMVSPSGLKTTIRNCTDEVPKNFCKRCSAYTELEDGVYPNRFNAIVCDDPIKGNRPAQCGSKKEGECEEITEVQTLLQLDPTAPCDKDGKPSFKEITYELPLCCGCKLV